jgi:hypothetical protein
MFSREPKLAQGPSASFSLTGTSHPCIVRLRSYRAVAAASILLAFFALLRVSSLSPLECALVDKHRVLPGFGRDRPPTTPLFSALTGSPTRKIFRIRTYKK